jgi:hypothetical protein
MAWQPVAARRGRPEQNLEALRNYAKILHLPQHMLWFDLPGQSRFMRPSEAGTGTSGRLIVRSNAMRFCLQILVWTHSNCFVGCACRR